MNFATSTASNVDSFFLALMTKAKNTDTDTEDFFCKKTYQNLPNIANILAALLGGVSLPKQSPTMFAMCAGDDARTCTVFADSFIITVYDQ